MGFILQSHLDWFPKQQNRKERGAVGLGEGRGLRRSVPNSPGLLLWSRNSLGCLFLSLFGSGGVRVFLLLPFDQRAEKGSPRC